MVETYGWLERNAPATFATLLPGAGETEIHAVEESTGLRFTDDLRQWFGHCGGVRNERLGEILPGWVSPFTLAQAVEHRDMHLRIRADPPELLQSNADGTLLKMTDFGWSPAWKFRSGPGVDDQPAGAPAQGWSAYWMPIGGETLFVDLRGGAEHGCVALFSDGDGETIGGARWSSIAALVTDVADSLEAGSRLGDFIPYVDERRVLRWELGDPQP